MTAHIPDAPRPPLAAQDVERLATDALLRGDPVAVALWQWGYRTGEQDAVDKNHARAEHTAARFLAYLAEEQEATPRPIPPLENYNPGRRGAA